MSIGSRTVRLDDGRLLVSGCRYHSCPEKSAVLTTPAGVPFAAALINWHCAEHCSDEPFLTVFVTRESNQPAIVKLFRDWAEQARRENNEKPESVSNVEIKIVP
jgi:hypothetical protein